MPPRLPDLTGQEDVYGTRMQPGPAASPGADVGVTVRLDPSPGALLRVFALLCTLELVPAASCGALLGGSCLRLDLAFEAIPPDRCDRLLRKLAQLTECLDVTCSARSPARAAVPPAA